MKDETTCPHCNGVGSEPTGCRCEILPVPGEPLKPCETCGEYRWSGCVTCDRTGEVSPRKFRELTMTRAEFEYYYRHEHATTLLDFFGAKDGGKA